MLRETGTTIARDTLGGGAFRGSPWSGRTDFWERGTDVVPCPDPRPPHLGSGPLRSVHQVRTDGRTLGSPDPDLCLVSPSGGRVDRRTTSVRSDRVTPPHRTTGDGGTGFVPSGPGTPTGLT